jgi:hypothetical protein
MRGSGQTCQADDDAVQASSFGGTLDEHDDMVLMAPRRVRRFDLTPQVGNVIA